MTFRQDNAASVRGLVLRVTRLASDGTPVVDSPNGCDTYLSSGFVSFTFTPSYSEADEISITNAAGATCVYYKAPDSLQSMEYGLEICDPDPLLTEMLIGGDVLLADSTSACAPAGLAAGDLVAVGYASPALGQPAEGYGVAVEVWTSAVLNGKSANKCPYWQYLFPQCTFKLDGDRVIENGNLATVFAGTGVGNASFGSGPYLDTSGVSPAVTGDTFAWPFPAVTDRPFAYTRVNYAPVGLNGCYANLGTVTGKKATKAVAGDPGSFGTAVTPANLAAMTTVTASPTTAWNGGQYVVLADASKAYWNGTTWTAGIAPDPVVAPTKAVAGIPGVYQPSGADYPANVAAMSAVVAVPATAWTTGQYVPLTTGTAYWNGTAWTSGAAT
ncbi:MAG: hypothetical protein ACOYD1_07700 [Candidatus Nanopelagicales bacterium]